MESGSKIMDHWNGFLQFTSLDKLAGGPDPHMKTIVEISQGHREKDRAWLAAVYACAVYNVPTAEALWHHWPLDKIQQANIIEVQQWCTENWPGLAFRRERRAVRTPVKLTQNLLSASTWIDKWFPRLHLLGYNELWDAVREIKYVGHYAAMKFLETLRQMNIVLRMIPDIRAKEGWSPREGLALLVPQHAELLKNGKSGADIHLIHEIAERVRLKAQDDGVLLNHYEYEVFLCDYKQASIGRRQYPGRSLDSEIDYAQKVLYFNWPSKFETQMFSSRQKLFPDWALGEAQGWSGVRKELGTVFSNHGYMWTDSLYDYVATKDLSNPTRRSS